MPALEFREVMSDKNEPFVCPESTIESANRRNFIKKAAMGTAAVAIGSTLIGSNAFPQSSAFAPETVYVKCNFISTGDVLVDWKNLNNGTLSPPPCQDEGSGGTRLSRTTDLLLTMPVNEPSCSHRTAGVRAQPRMET